MLCVRTEGVNTDLLFQSININARFQHGTRRSVIFAIRKNGARSFVILDTQRRNIFILLKPMEKKQTFRFGDIVECTHHRNGQIFKTQEGETIHTEGIVIMTDSRDDRILIAIPNVGYDRVTMWWPMKFARIIKKSQFPL